MGKISLIFGVVHMTFGVLMSLWNKINRRQYHAIILEFFPQIAFLLLLFGYLIVLIFIKWILYGANYADPWSEHCAPNLLITFINMMLFKNDPPDETMVNCHVDGHNYDIYMFGNPLYILFARYNRRRNYNTIQDELLSDEGEFSDQGDEEDFSEIMINQGIHTIEYALGSVSHTASYLRLWALSLAHNQLSEVLWSMVLSSAFTTSGYVGAIMLYPIFAGWAALTISVMVLMEGLSAFLHTLRLHWVEFCSKFYDGSGTQFVPFQFRVILKEAAADDEELLKAVTASK